MTATQRTRSVLPAAGLLALAASATAATPPQPLRVHLEIVESCDDAPAQPGGTTHCAAPHQRAEAAQLPDHLRRLSPDPDAKDGSRRIHLVF